MNSLETTAALALTGSTLLYILAPAALVRRVAAWLFLATWTASLYLLAPSELRMFVPLCALSGAALLAILTRWWKPGPTLIACALILAMAIRVPLEAGGDTVRLLVPLYALLFAAVALEAEASGRPGRRAGAVDLTVAVFVAWAGLSALWASDGESALVEIALLMCPFACMYGWLSRAAWSRRTGAVTGLAFAAAAAVAGLSQWATRDLWQNAKVEVANQYGYVFRTNSFFWDPNIYGRYLAIAALLVLTVLVFTRWSGRVAAATCALGGLYLAALFLTYSQSSFLALAAGATVLALYTVAGRKPGTVVAIATSVIVAGGLALSATAGDKGARERTQIAREGVRIAADQPLHGVGVGSFEHEHARRADSGHRHTRLRASHTTPVTVAAELGVIGLVAYLMLLLAACRAALQLRGSAAHMWAAAAFAALVVHSLLYAGFFDDPLLWLVLAVLANGVGELVGSRRVVVGRRGNSR